MTTSETVEQAIARLQKKLPAQFQLPCGKCGRPVNIEKEVFLNLIKECGNVKDAYGAFECIHCKDNGNTLDLSTEIDKLGYVYPQKGTLQYWLDNVLGYPKLIHRFGKPGVKDSEKMITDGHVRVNGFTVSNPDNAVKTGYFIVWGMTRYGRKDVVVVP